MLLKNCLLVSIDPPGTERSDLRIDGGLIAARGPHLRAGEGEEIIDLRGSVVIPGMVCAHTHLYSSLARGMPSPARKPANFRQILRRIWWKLDRALDERSIYFSALAGALEALRSGTTLIVDHHASPGAIAGSLDIVRDALGAVGLRGVLCYEVTDRGGRKERDAGLRENGRFLSACDGDAMFRGLVGAHAAFTLSDSSLRACAELAGAFRTGVHIHVAEDMCDLNDRRARQSGGILRRLERAGAAGERSVFAHGVHLAPGEFRSMARTGAWLVHNPRSNMNNGVGHAPVHLFPSRSALGTDGFTADMFEEARAGYLRAEEDSIAGAARIPGLVAGGWRLATEIFGGKFGPLLPGAPADLAVLEYRPQTPLTGGSIAGHLLFGFSSSAVSSVMVGGKWLLWNRAVPHLDEERLAERMRREAKRLWNSIS